jgi:ferredoxin
MLPVAPHNAAGRGYNADGKDVLVKLRVDSTKCAGIGLCEVAAPTVYQVGDDGQSHLTHDTPDDSEMSAVTEAIANCPTGALSIESDEY